MRRTLVAAGLVVVMLLTWYLALWRPDRAHLASSRAAIAAAELRGRRLELQRAGLLALHRQLPGLESQLRAAEPQMPVAPSIDTLIDQIDAVAVGDGVTWSKESQSLASPSPTPAGGGGGATAAQPASATVVLGLTVSGTYARTAKFLTDLAQRPRLIVIDTLTYGVQGAEGVDVAITARAFYDTVPVPALTSGAGTR